MRTRSQNSNISRMKTCLPSAIPRVPAQTKLSNFSSGNPEIRDGGSKCQLSRSMQQPEQSR